MKFFKKSLIRSLWTVLTVVFAILLAVSIAGDIVGNSLKRTINEFLGLPNIRTEVDEEAAKNKIHYKSEFEKADGSYDDAALWAEDVKYSDQVQREGTTILWNRDKQGHKGQDGQPVQPFLRRFRLFGHGFGQIVYAARISRRQPQRPQKGL